MASLRLYHILPTEFGVSNLALRRLKISRIQDLNDPFDLLPYKFENDEMKQGWERSKEQIHSDRGVLCFSKNWQNPVLWSHYGDKHRGMCLGFDVPDDKHRHIDYIPERLDFKDISPDMAIGFLYSKYQHWHYEEEHRSYVSLDPSTSENGLFFMEFGEGLILREVIIGLTCPVPLQRIQILLQNLGPGIALSKAILDPDHFRLTFDPSTRWVS